MTAEEGLNLAGVEAVLVVTDARRREVYVSVHADGAVVGTGTHDELLATCGTYQEIVQSQLTAEEVA